MLSGHPAISDFLLYDKKWKKLPLPMRLLQETKLLQRIRKGKYDLVINLTEGDRGALAAKVSKARYCVGFDAEGSGMKGKNKCYTHVVRICHKPRHTVERHLDVLRCLGISIPEEERDVTFHIPPEARLQNLPSNYVLIHPVSRWLFKALPASTIANLIQELHLRGKNLVISSSPDPEEMAMVRKILRLAPNIPVTNFAGKTTLKELGSLIEQAELLITVDSLPLHISSATKTPVIAIFGPTSEETWAPWKNPNSIVVTKSMPCRPCYMPGCGGSGRSDCLETLKSSQILSAVDSLLAPNIKALL
ncbi:MAG: lipopolysaccharide core heptosyltransferase RfaQ [Chlamydiales bacterium]